MVDVNNGLVGIVWALTGKNEKDKFYMYRACVEGEMWEREAREAEKRQWMGGERRGERAGDMRMEKRDGEKSRRVGKKEYKGWKRTQKRGQKRVKDSVQ